MKRIFTSIVFILLPISLLGQTNLTEREGVSRSIENDIIVMFDNFTGEAIITVNDSSKAKHTINNQNVLVIPSYGRETEQEDLVVNRYDDKSQNWALTFYHKGKEKFFNIDTGSHSVPFLIDDIRLTLEAVLISNTTQDSISQTLTFELSESKWNQMKSAQDVRFRIAGEITELPDSTLDQMARIYDKVKELKSDTDSEAQNDQVNSSSPYQLQWEGDLDRTPQVQPLPANPTNEEATITIRFQVNPDGSLGQVLSLRKMNPELEQEVIRTLRSWRFSRLPQGVPQEPQWGVITFRFVLD